MMVGTILVQLRSIVLTAVKRKQPVALRVAGGKKLVLRCCRVRRDDQSSIELPASRSCSPGHGAGSQARRGYPFRLQ